MNLSNAIRRSALNWEVGHAGDAAERPQRWVPATVPGAVQLDWAAAEGWGDPFYADHWRQYGWMEDRFWHYRARIEPPALAPGQRLLFVCGGIDYRFQVRVEGRVLLDQEGMFTPVELDLTDAAAKGGWLEVLVWPAPKSRPAPADRVQANRSCKPAVAYGWDFHPRLIPLGIWQDAALEVRPGVHLADAEVQYALSPSLDAAQLTLRASLNRPGSGQWRWRVEDPDGRLVVETLKADAGRAVTLGAEIRNPALWWPNGQGAPALYRSTLEWAPADGGAVQRAEQRLGLRRVRLVMHPGAWDEPAHNAFPKGRSNPPITLEINGRRIFCKGSNWVTPDVFPGRLTRADYERQLLLARDAHLNLLRCWGGANVQKEAFFDLCDELGLMVWQEFPLACNRYEGTPDYLAVLDAESRSIIRRLRPHPSVVLWCGGNELFNVWSGMTDQDLALRLLNRNCYDMDPERPFLMTSPMMGMGHGHYVFRSPEGDEVFQIFARARCTAYTEFGCPAPSPAGVLRRIIPAEQLFPPREGTPWETHHAFKAWQPNSHLMLDVIDHYFGPSASLEELVARGQLLQTEGLKCLFEEARRQKPRAAMALNWCFNEPWPCAANMSVIAWPAEPKAGYEALRAACRPALASARIPRFTWTEGDTFAPELWLLNDAPEPLPAGMVEAWLDLGGRRILLLRWDHAGAPAQTNLAGPTARVVLGRGEAGPMTLSLRCPARPELDSAYTLLYRPAAATAAGDGTRALNQ